MVGSSTGRNRDTIAKASTRAQPQPDRLLAERARAGHRESFNLLVLKYRQRIRNVIGRIVQNPEDVAEVTQEAFLKAYQAIGKFRGDSSFYTWMYRIAVNSAMHHCAFMARRPQLESGGGNALEGQIDFLAALSHNDDPEHLLLSEEIRRVILNAFEQLPRELRVAITLHEVDGLRYKEISEIMRCPIGTVRSRIFRARRSIDSSLRLLLQ